MIYDIRQTTIYDYASKVAFAHHVLHLMPINRPHQRVHAAALEIFPVPVERREGFDFFGNHVTWIGLEEPHDSLSIKVAARVAVEVPADPAPPATPAWEQVRADVMMTRDLGATSPAHFLFASRQVSLDPEIADYARASFLAGRPIFDSAADLMARIKADFVYEIGATSVATTPSDAYVLRRGVCQDFAHIMIALVRHVRIPCRYVSGYVYRRSENHDRSPEGATHAWVEALLPGLGWVGFDPTNNLIAGERHIRTAIGRDYADVPPTKGIFKGKSESQLTVSVRVAPSDAPRPPEEVLLPPEDWQAAIAAADEAERLQQQQQQQQQQQ
jgi:transglutaminase-like putative cysteine protease